VNTTALIAKYNSRITYCATRIRILIYDTALKEQATIQSPENRTDVEVLFEGLPEPIDLEIDVYNRVLYWTDRGDPPRGNTVSFSFF
jgi:hypothetical protein